MAIDKRFRLGSTQQLTSEIVTNLYLYEELTNPTGDGLLDSNLIRSELNIPDTAETASDLGSGFNLVTVEIDAVPYMETGSGRFANGSQFELVERFFDSAANSLLTPGRIYNKTDLRDALFPTLVFLGSAIEQRNYEDSVNDFDERVYIWNSSVFALSDNVEFVLNTNGTKEIRNFRIEPNKFSKLNLKENFDFDTANPFVEQFSKLELKPRVDPSEIGRTVFIDFYNRNSLPFYDPVNTGSSAGIYDEDDYLKDLQDEESNRINPLLSNTFDLIRVRNETVEIAITFTI